MTENSDLNGDSPQFTITCVSMGGPVGCVVWRINKNVILNPNATSVLLDRVNGMYVHNLTVSEVVGGSYSCSVANEKPTSAYEGLSIACKLCVCVPVCVCVCVCACVCVCTCVCVCVCV